MQIQISIQRPILILSILAGTGILLAWPAAKEGVLAIGGTSSGPEIVQATADIDRERIRQALIDHREDILRYELLRLEDIAAKTNSGQALTDLAAHRAVLIELIKQRKHSEELLLASLQSLWEAEGTEYYVREPVIDAQLAWPVEPTLGISAGFLDPDYEQLFHGLKHHAVDIPTEQGTPLRAAADGTVTAAKDSGLGYSFVSVKHEGKLMNFETIDGHMSAIFVREGDRVLKGQTIGLSGGMPGAPGTGLLSTGPHVHFAVKYKGVLVDPMKYLEGK